MTCPHCQGHVQPGEVCDGCGYRPPVQDKDWRWRGNTPRYKNPLFYLLERFSDIVDTHEAVDKLMNNVYEISLRLKKSGKFPKTLKELNNAYNHLGEAAGALNRAKTILRMKRRR